MKYFGALKAGSTIANTWAITHATNKYVIADLNILRLLNSAMYFLKFTLNQSSFLFNKIQFFTLIISAGLERLEATEKGLRQKDEYPKSSA